MVSLEGSVPGSGRVEVFLLVFFDSHGTTPYYGALMAEGATPKTLPRHVNPRKLAYMGTHLSGTVDAKSLDTLLDAVDSVGDVSAVLDFSISDQGKILVEGQVDADIAFQCQRCLKTIPQRRVVAKVCVAVVRAEEDAKQLPSQLDPWVVIEEEADLYSLVAEEILLALPVAAYHDYQCVDLGSIGSAPADIENNKDGPFSVLSSLKKRARPDDEID